jgi:uncharacterized protein YbjT (DUF2867 family)
MVRDPDTAALPPQVEVLRGDLTVPETLNDSLPGIDSVFLVWTAPPEAAASAVECITGHARRVVYLSAPLKTPAFQASQPNPSSLLHEEIERLIQQSAVEWTILRPGMFASNALAWWAPRIRTGNVVRWPYLAAPTAPIDQRDIASVAVRALLEKGHAGTVYLAGAGCGDVAEVLGGGNRPTRIRDQHGRGGYRNTRTDVLRVGQRSLAGVSSLIERVLGPRSRSSNSLSTQRDHELVDRQRREHSP